MAALDTLARRAADGAIFLDFDGTLSPIVDDPADARPVEGAIDVISALAGYFRVVAVISGRGVRDLSSRLRVPERVRLVGLHGMETLRDGEVVVAPGAHAAKAKVEAAHAALQQALRGVRGAMLEHKGLALAIHFRRAVDPDAVEKLASPFVYAAADANGLHVVPGRRVLEIRPPEAGDKGDAVRAIIDETGVRAGLAAGDDVGDLPAFAALDGLDVAVRIAVGSTESPVQLIDAADVVVADPAGVVAHLRTLAGAAARA